MFNSFQPGLVKWPLYSKTIVQYVLMLLFLHDYYHCFSSKLDKFDFRKCDPIPLSNKFLVNSLPESTWLMQQGRHDVNNNLLQQSFFCPLNGFDFASKIILFSDILHSNIFTWYSWKY